jgi:Ca2+/H+ antiporter, TMEM165/GDT1 family
VVFLYAPVFIPAFLITLLEMTEVVALVFALSAGGPSLRTAILGALSGVALVAFIALVAGAAIERLPPSYLLGPSALVLAGFGVFLFRSTLRSYRRARASAAGTTAARAEPHPVVQFGGGFSVGVVESTEAVIVLLALAAPGYGLTTIVAALVAGGLLIVLAWALHGQIRRIKVPWLKAGATSLLFTFSVFWAGETLHIAWPGNDLFLLPLFVVAVILVRVAIGVFDRPSVRIETKS